MTIRELILPTLLLALITAGCSGPVEGDDDVSDDDDDTGGSYEVTVAFEAEEPIVDLFDLDASDWQGSPAVTLPDILGDAGVLGPNGFTYTFIAYDDYSRAGVDWGNVYQAVLIQESGDLQYPDDLGVEGDDFVKGVVRIELEPVGD